MYQQQLSSIKKLHYTKHPLWYSYDAAIEHIKIKNILRYKNTDELIRNKSGQVLPSTKTKNVRNICGDLREICVRNNFQYNEHDQMNTNFYQMMIFIS